MNALLLRYRFRLLFFSTVLFTAILGLPSSTKPRVLGSLLLLVLAGMNTLRRRSPLVYLTAFFGLFSLALYTTADFSSPYSSLPPGLLRGLSLILLYLTLFAALFRRVTQERPVTHCSAVAVLARIWKINDAVEMAPEDAQPIEYQRKLTRRGLGFTQARSSQTGGIASASQHPKYLQALAGRTSEYPTRRRLAQVARLSCAPNRHGTPGSSLRTYHPVLAEGH